MTTPTRFKGGYERAYEQGEVGEKERPFFDLGIKRVRNCTIRQGWRPELRVWRIYFRDGSEVRVRNRPVVAEESAQDLRRCPKCYTCPLRPDGSCQHCDG